MGLLFLKYDMKTVKLNDIKLTEKPKKLVADVFCKISPEEALEKLNYFEKNKVDIVWTDTGFDVYISLAEAYRKSYERRHLMRWKTRDGKYIICTYPGIIEVLVEAGKLLLRILDSDNRYAEFDESNTDDALTFIVDYVLET